MKSLDVIDINKWKNRDITNLDIRKISENGFYKDKKKNIIFRLTDEEIDTLRSIHRNPKIAKNRLKNDLQVKVRIYNEKAIKNTKRIKRKSNHKQIRRKPKNTGYKEVIVKVGLSVLIAGSLFAGYKALEKNTNAIHVDNMTTYEHIQNIKVVEDKKVDSPKLIRLDSEDVNLITRDMIRKYCSIYQVSEDVVVNILEKLTNNYTSDEYLNDCNITGIVCKGKQVEPSSYEELLIYVVRNIKQDPGKFGLTYEQVNVNTGYISDSDYYKEIAYYSRLFGLDEALVAAIVNSECGFDSNLFNVYNNPAGLRLSSGWWQFSTKEEGFIELCLELIKYYNKIDVPRNQVDYDTLTKIRDIHAPLSDGNNYWLGNVTESYQKYDMNRDEYFSLEEKKMNERRI